MAKKNVTEEFIKDRIDGNKTEAIETGKWYSGFKKVKKYAVENKIPFVAVWSNGESCSLCRKLEQNFMTNAFKAWMGGAGCIFWFGYSGDTDKEDAMAGAGFEWARNKTLNYYPFMRFYWADGKNKVNYAASGNEWNMGKTGVAGAKNIIAKLSKLLEKAGKSLKIRTNPEWSDEEVAEFKKAIKENGGYCPCSVEKSKDTKCMCKSFREQKTEGTCHCGLYNKYYA